MISDKALLGISIVLFVLSAGWLLVSYNQITGFVTTSTSTATANLTVETAVVINFSTNNIDWGSGMVNAGESNATLNTAAGASNVTRGNWTGNTAGFVLDNIGNVNVSLTLAAGKSAANFIGGTNPVYEWNVSNVDAGACGHSNSSMFQIFNSTTTGASRVCGNFSFVSGQNRIRIDLKIAVPSDSKTGALGDTITAAGSIP